MLGDDEALTMRGVAARLSGLVGAEDGAEVVAALERQQAELRDERAAADGRFAEAVGELASERENRIRRAELELAGITTMLDSLRDG